MSTSIHASFVSVVFVLISKIEGVYFTRSHIVESVGWEKRIKVSEGISIL